MLYDPKKEHGTVEHFIAWLETKDPKKKYNFGDCNGRCLIGQYMNDIGIEWNGHPSGEAGRAYQRIASLGDGAVGLAAMEPPNTFRAAHERLLDLLRDGTLRS